MFAHVCNSLGPRFRRPGCYRLLCNTTLTARLSWSFYYMIMRLFFSVSRGGPRAGRSGPCALPLHFAVVPQGDLAPPGAGSGSAPCAPVQTKYPLQVTCMHKSWGRPSLPSSPPSSYGEIRLLARQYPIAAFHFSLAAGPPIHLQVS